MSSVTSEIILTNLKRVIDPTFNRDIVSLNHVSNIVIKKEKIEMDVILRTPDAFENEIKSSIERELASLSGIKKVSINFIVTIDRPVDEITTGTVPRAHKPLLTNVKNIIGIASNKGGVGKSTVSSNLACALKELGAKVALIDLDFYGPNIPTMFGVDNQPAFMENNMIQPIKQYGIDLMSVGFILESDGNPVILRAPLVNQLFMEFLSHVNWGDYDYLVADLPPGTGDIQLTLAQQLPNTRMVFVTTPQDVALADVMKGVKMFQQQGVELPIVGIIENMSYFVCDHGQKYEIFGSGGAKKVANKFKINILGQLPLIPKIREQGDKGKPIVIADSKNPVSEEFIKIARQITVELAKNTFEINEKRKNQVHIDLEL
jgi:ATP-binding protein involved in chromosome partitioning